MFKLLKVCNGICKHQKKLKNYKAKQKKKINKNKSNHFLSHLVSVCALYVCACMLLVCSSSFALCHRFFLWLAVPTKKKPTNCNRELLLGSAQHQFHIWPESMQCAATLAAAAAAALHRYAISRFFNLTVGSLLKY